MHKALKEALGIPRLARTRASLGTRAFFLFFFPLDDIKENAWQHRGAGISPACREGVPPSPAVRKPLGRWRGRPVDPSETLIVPDADV